MSHFNNIHCGQYATILTETPLPVATQTNARGILYGSAAAEFPDGTVGLAFPCVGFFMLANGCMSTSVAECGLRRRPDCVWVECGEARVGCAFVCSSLFCSCLKTWSLPLLSRGSLRDRQERRKKEKTLLEQHIHKTFRHTCQDVGHYADLSRVPRRPGV